MCSNCAVGYYSSSAGSSLCSVCAAGMSCTSSSSQPCAAGTYGIEGEMGCRPCTAGHFSESGASNCTACPAGKDCSSAVGSPPNCSAGQYSVEEDAGCTNCPQGIHCTLHSVLHASGRVLCLRIFCMFLSQKHFITYEYIPKHNRMLCGCPWNISICMLHVIFQPYHI